MEIALEQGIPTYSGGLGVLAGDTLRAGADLELPMVAVTLLHRKGYFTQRLNAAGGQTESATDWHPEERMKAMTPTVTIEVEGRPVAVRAWRYLIRGVAGHTLPVYLLDTALPQNGEFDRTITDTLYGGDAHYRLCQEVVLGMGGVAMLRALGHEGDLCCHINEGHASLLTLSLLERQLAGRTRWDITDADLNAVRQQAVFTTHTPVPAGHDKFPLDLARQVLGGDRVATLEAAGAIENGELNMTAVALRLTRYVNAVALRHKEVSIEMFPNHTIDAITNGVHAVTWTSEPFRELFDRCIPGWRRDNHYLRYASTIGLDDIRAAHTRAKQALLAEVARRSGVQLDARVMTIGFARRSTPYKRADLIFSDLERLRRIGKRVGPLQIVFGGKAHPHDGLGKALITQIFAAAEALGEDARVVYVENYELDLGALMTSGVDLWLNNPMRPLEASGTSGMKAALNGVPSLSVLDGWWVEGHVEGVTGWAVGADEPLPVNPSRDIESLYSQLERVILPLYYGLPYRWAEVMRNAIALNGSFFNTHRMVEQYVRHAYFPAGGAPVADEILAAR
ncbi:MAG: alpha-glucan family phosphorylase [Gemmatimonadota bacterium]|nr:alpha-glucan family phosphorylase [Gemmatimonadota bacterium]